MIIRSGRSPFISLYFFSAAVEKFREWRWWLWCTRRLCGHEPLNLIKRIVLKQWQFRCHRLQVLSHRFKFKLSPLAKRNGERIHEDIATPLKGYCRSSSDKIGTLEMVRLGCTTAADVTSLRTCQYGFLAVQLLTTAGKCPVSRTFHFTSRSLLFPSQLNAFFSIWAG